ncbi:MAG: LysR family transcriptional regulator [Planctomycetes bacterium]|nr:LysR family transcriptional regulator [Planctomycetota bacterium]
MQNQPDLPPHALAALVAIADSGSVSAAARLRGLTQPTLSRHIQDLERAVGAKLIERSNQGARLTPAGETLAQGGRQILADLGILAARVRAAGDEVGGEVRLGCIDSIGIYVLPEILPAFVQANPRVRVTVVCQSSPQLMEMLLLGELDVAIGTTEHPGLRSERLYQNPLVLVHPHGMPEAEVPSTLAELAARPVITFASGLTVRRLLDDAFARAGLRFQPVMELANVEVIKAMVRSGLGLGVIPDGCLPHGELAARPIPECSVARVIRLMQPNREPSSAVERLIGRIRSLRRI